MRPLQIAACAALMLGVGLPTLAVDVPADPIERPITAGERDHWAYRALSTVEPPSVNDIRWNRHPVDRFLKAEMQARVIDPLPASGKATLLRRLSFDLTGLPPTPREALDFQADAAPDAYEKLVDRLLSSPAYGQRWAQHWLDLARFAETDGFEHDLVRPNAWRYRDWVIDSLNRDMAFDEFVRLQIAGDELRPDDPEAAIATGFLLCGPDMPDLNLQEERRHVVLNEITSTIGAVFLGMQLGCAQCHDHKFDPIRQHDFYRLRAFFEPADMFREHPVPTAAELAARQAAEAARPPEERQQDERRKELEELGRQHFREKNPDERPGLKAALAELSKQEQQEHAQLVKQLRKARDLPDLSMGRVVHDGAPRAGHVYLRGDFRQPGPLVRSGFPRVLATAESDAGDEPEQPRAKLAAWLTGPDQPLLARVIANRLWQWHFGSGLSTSASDFGVMGSPPSNPDLLDWLARQLMRDGWSLKKMHRLLVTSEAYRTASGTFDVGWSDDETRQAAETWRRSQAQDPQNEYLWRRRRLRLDGESVRDAMLVACERLSPRRGGPGIRPPLPPDVTATLLTDQRKVSGDDEDHRRRSIYLFVRRNLRYPMFDVFDRPDTNASCALRHESTTATQSLVLFNSSFSLECARWLAGVLLKSRPDDVAGQIDEAYRRVFSRPASEEETRLGRDFLQRQQAQLRAGGRSVESLSLPAGTEATADPFQAAALVDYCLALFNANEFVYLD